MYIVCSSLTTAKNSSPNFRRTGEIKCASPDFLQTPNCVSSSVYVVDSLCFFIQNWVCAYAPCVYLCPTDYGFAPFPGMSWLPLGSINDPAISIRKTSPTLRVTTATNDHPAAVFSTESICIRLGLSLRAITVLRMLVGEKFGKLVGVSICGKCRNALQMTWFFGLGRGAVSTKNLASIQSVYHKMFINAVRASYNRHSLMMHFKCKYLWHDAFEYYKHASERVWLCSSILLELLGNSSCTFYTNFAFFISPTSYLHSAQLTQLHPGTRLNGIHLHSSS